MAKKAVIFSILVLTIIVVLSESGVLNSLLIFLLIGAVPGTTITISPTVMLIIIGAGLWATIFHLTAGKFLSSRRTKRLIKKHITRKQTMPKRRYSRI